MVTSLPLFEPTDLERLVQNPTQSKHLPELSAYTEDWLLHLFLTVNLIEAAQYPSDTYLSSKPVVSLEVEILKGSDCWWVHSSFCLFSIDTKSQHSPSITGWLFLLWRYVIAEQGSCDKKRRLQFRNLGPLGTTFHITLRQGADIHIRSREALRLHRTYSTFTLEKVNESCKS